MKREKFAACGTIHKRDRVAGGSVFWLTDNVDGGPIAAHEHVFVRPRDTAESLWREVLALLGVRLILRTRGKSRRASWSKSRRTRHWQPGNNRLTAPTSGQSSCN